MANPGKKRSLSPVNDQVDSAASNEGWTTVSGSARKKPKKEKVKKGQPANISGSNAKSHAQIIDEAVAQGSIAAPLFQFDPAGFRHRQIGVADIRDLIVHIVWRESHPKWLKITNKAAIRGVVCLLVQGFEPSDLGLPAEISSTMPQPLEASKTASTSKLPIFQELFSHYCPTRAPGEHKKLHSVLQTLLNCPLTGDQKAKRQKEKEKAASSSAGGVDPAIYLLPADEFLGNGYVSPSYPFDTTSRIRSSHGSNGVKQANGSSTPNGGSKATALPFERWQRDDGMIETPQIEYADNEQPPLLKIIGIDCEMCVTTVGSEVCRVSVVDAAGKVIYNTLVKPANEVRDYATQFSGITEELLAPVTTTLHDVHKELAKIIDYDTVLVGHSLNCDLVVLKLVHPWVIDTSVIYHHTRGPPYKASLKWLAQKWLSKEIQKPSKLSDGLQIVGHNSEEDARAAVELVKLKMTKGPTFGEFATDMESIFERLAMADPKKRTAIVDHGNPAQWHGAKADTAVACKTDDEIVSGIRDNVINSEFVFARLLDTSHALEWSQPSNNVLGKTTASAKAEAITEVTADAMPSNGISPSTISTSSDPYTKLNEQIRAIHKSLPINTAFIIMSGHGDPRTVTALSAKKARFDLLYKTQLLSSISEEDKWSEADDRALLTAVARVREGMTFLSIKR